MAQLVGASSVHQKVRGSIPGQATYIGCGFDPGGGVYGKQSINVSHMDVYLPPSLSKINKHIKQFFSIKIQKMDILYLGTSALVGLIFKGKYMY